MASTKNLRLKSVGSHKLLPTWVDPFMVAWTVSAIAYRLALPPMLRAIYPVFHLGAVSRHFLIPDWLTAECTNKWHRVTFAGE